MWESLCANVQINYGGNQEPFDQVDQCQSQVCPFLCMGWLSCTATISVSRKTGLFWQHTLMKGMGPAPTLCALGIRGAPCTILRNGFLMVDVRCLTQGCLLHAMLELL